MEAASLKKSTRVPILKTVGGKTLSSFADAAMLSNARILNEGAIVDGDSGERVYAGSTMLSLDLRGGPSIDCGGATDEELCEHVRNSLGFHVRLMRVARAEAERRTAPYLLCEMRCAFAFRIEGGVLFVDIDLECPLAAPLDATGEEERGAP